MDSINLQTEPSENSPAMGASVSRPAAIAVQEHQLKQILVPVDFSAPSEAALDHALLIAEHFGAKISLLHVIEPRKYDDDLSDWYGDFTGLAQSARTRLSMMAERMIKPSAMGTVQTRQGKPFHEISEGANEIACDLIVIASHGYTGLRHAIMGSVAERVAREAPYPVLVVRRSPEGDVASTGLIRLKKILVPIDFSTASLRTLDYALWFARRFEAKVTALHVVEPPGLTAWLHVHPPQVEGDLRQAAASKMDALQIDSSDSHKVERQLRIGVPLKEILNAACSGDFDLLVISSHLTASRGGGYLMGTTTERLLRHATCPVLIVRERNTREEGTIAPAADPTSTGTA